MTDSTASYEQHIEAARLAHGRGDRAGTEQALQAAIRAAEARPDSHLKLVAALIKLGELKHAEGAHDDAEALFRRALDIGERVLGQDDLALVPPLTSLGALRIARGRPEDAAPLLTRALEISERSLGRDHPDLVVLLNNLSRHYLKQSAYAFAEPLLLQLYSIKRAKGEDHPEVATVLASLAAVRQALGRHDAAEQLWRRVLDIRERTLAPNHFATATAIEHLAETCAARGKLSEALQLFQRALEMRELTLGAAHPSLRVSRERIADLQLQGSEESFDLGGTEPLAGFADWGLPPTPDVPAAPELTEPVRSVMVSEPVRPAIVSEPVRPAIAPEPIRPAKEPEPMRAAVRPAEPERRAPSPRMPEPVVRTAPTREAAPAVATAPDASPAVTVRAPAARPAFTPESDAHPTLQQAAEPRPEYSPETFADDDEEPSTLRLYAVGTSGQPGAALVMPSFAGDLAAIEEELAEQDENAKFSNRARAVAGSAAAFVRSRPVPLIAVGVGAAALAIFAMGSGSSAQSGTLGFRTGAQPQALPTAAPVLDSASGALGANGSLDATVTDRPVSTPVANADRGNGSSSAQESSSRNSAKAATPERPSAAPATAPVPDLSRPVAGAVNAQLDSAMRAAGGSGPAVNDGFTRPAVTFAPGLLAQPGGAIAADKPSQPELIGGMPKIAYPQALRAKGREVQGQVLVEFSVDTTGRPDMATLSVLQSDHELFTAAVRKAIPSMRFVPGVENGRKVRALVTKQFRFAIDR
jgi:TonB family protein